MPIAKSRRTVSAVALGALVVLALALAPASGARGDGLQECGTVDFSYTNARVSAKAVNCSSARRVVRKWFDAAEPCTAFPCHSRVQNFRCTFKGSEAHLKLRCKGLNDSRKHVHADWGG